MKNDIVSKIIKLSDNNSPMKLLQLAYVSVGIVFVVVAGIFSLFNQAIGFGLLIVPLIALVAFVLNIVAWALISLAVSAAHDHQKATKTKNIRRK